MNFRRSGLISVMAAFAACFFLFSACSDDTMEGLVTQDTMILVLRDMHIAHAGIDNQENNPQLKLEKYQDFNRLILDEYELNHEDFYMTYEFYQEHPILLDSLYIKIISEINIELTTLQQGKKAKTKIPIAQ